MGGTCLALRYAAELSRRMTTNRSARHPSGFRYQDWSRNRLRAAQRLARPSPCRANHRCPRRRFLSVNAADGEAPEPARRSSGTTRGTDVVLRELFARAAHRVLVVGFAVQQGREIFAALADRMCHRADLAIRLCLDIRRALGRGQTHCCADSLNTSSARNGRDRGCLICSTIPEA